MKPASRNYCGRFAPSPTGPLHAGSLVSALASFLDARAHQGRWLVRIEDLDTPRNLPGSAAQILATLASLGMRADAEPVWQSQRLDAYQAALDQLDAVGLLYPCGCTRREVADSLASAHRRHATLAYRGTCRDGLHGKPARAWRLRVPEAKLARIDFADRWQGPQNQNLARDVGDFILKRADGQWAYQLAVVVDDASAGVTHVVRGADLLDSTARQIYLQRVLNLSTPAYLHIPVVTQRDGEKLSKQTGAVAIDLSAPLEALQRAARHLELGLPVGLSSIEDFFERAVAAWQLRFAGR